MINICPPILTCVYRKIIYVNNDTLNRIFIYNYFMHSDILDDFDPKVNLEADFQEDPKS